MLDRTIDSADAETQVSGESVSKEAPHIADRLDGRTDDCAEGQGPADRTARQRGRARLRNWLARGAQFFVTQSSSSLTRRIVVLNVTGLVVLS
ncbi:MAG: sensor N-terminal transmembrane domain-containing protein, partial [Xanthobacteraceae bacterium]